MKENATFAGVNNGLAGFTMIRLQTFATILFLMLGGGYINAGEHGEPDFSKGFSFDPYPDSQGRIVNDILQTIAKGSGKLRVHTEYSFRGLLRAELSPIAADRHRAVITPDSIYVTGDVSYRDFSLARILIPDKASFLLEVLDAEGEKVYGHFFEDVDITAAADHWAEVSFPYDGATGDLSVELSGYRFWYDDRMREHLEHWGVALETYYEAGEKLKRAEGLTEGLSADNPETLLLEEFRLCEAEAMLGNIRHAPFQQWLDLYQHDPENILRKSERLNRELSLLRRDFNQAVSRIDELYYERGEMIAHSESPDNARDAYESALDYNPLHIPSHLALVKLDMHAGEKETALERMGTVFDKGYPSGEWKEKALMLADTVLDSFFMASSELIFEDRLTASLDNLEHVELFCSRVKGNYPCPGDLRNLLIRTHHGIYRSFLVVSRRAIRNDNMDFAATYIENALEYQQMHPEYVRSSEEALELLLRVMTRYRVLADFSSLMGEPNGRDEYLSKVRRIADSHPELFDFVSGVVNPDMLGTAALNYAAAGQPHQSIHLLKELESRGVSAEETAYLQRQAGVASAFFFKNDRGADKKPETLVDELTGGKAWFRFFKESFMDSW